MARDITRPECSSELKSMLDQRLDKGQSLRSWRCLSSRTICLTNRPGIARDKLSRDRQIWWRTSEIRDRESVFVQALIRAIQERRIISGFEFTLFALIWTRTTQLATSVKKYAFDPSLSSTSVQERRSGGQEVKQLTISEPSGRYDQQQWKPHFMTKHLGHFAMFCFDSVCIEKKT
jgi:hypothetical protein